MKAPVDAFHFWRSCRSIRCLFDGGVSNSAALSKIRAFLNKWRPVRNALPIVATELEALGMARGAKFDQIIEQVFAMQLTGRGKTKEERGKDPAQAERHQGTSEEEREGKEAREGHRQSARRRGDGRCRQAQTCGSDPRSQTRAKGKPASVKPTAKHAAQLSTGKGPLRQEEESRA